MIRLPDFGLMRRHPSAYTSSFSAGPGPLSTALKAIIVANVVLFLRVSVRFRVEPSSTNSGCVPFRFLHELRLWQPVTYMFLHAGIFHILFNMLGALVDWHRARADLGDAVLS